MSNLETIIIEIEESENFAVIYLNRPDQLNALNFQFSPKRPIWVKICNKF